MGFFSKFEGRMEDGLEGAANKMFDAPISPVQIAKKAEKAMRREKMVGAGKQYAPTLYTVLVNPRDDQRLFGYYPTLAGETETYLSAKAAEEGLLMDGQPLVRFIEDEGLKHGKFDIIAELVSAPIIARLRQEEMHRYGLAGAPAQQPRSAASQPKAAAFTPIQSADAAAVQSQMRQPMAQPAAQPERKQSLPYVPEEEIDRSIDYGEYTFNSQDFEDYSEHGAAETPLPDDVHAAHRRRDSQPIPTIHSDNIGNDFSGLDVDTYDAASDSSPFDISNDFEAAPLHDFAAPAAVPLVAANTSVFASGRGEVDPIPNPTSVHARLTDTATGRVYDLASSRIVIGRSSGSDIVIDDINASRQHAEIRLEPQNAWSINDLGSTNGTMVNGRHISSVLLNEGDTISIGMTAFVFSRA